VVRAPAPRPFNVAAFSTLMALGTGDGDTQANALNRTSEPTVQLNMCGCSGGMLGKANELIGFNRIGGVPSCRKIKM
jgi:hypothetical protein